MTLNNQLGNGTITWDGSKTNDVVPVSRGMGTKILVRINNGAIGQSLTVTFEYNTDGANWRQWYNNALPPVAVSFTHAASLDLIYGPFEGFPAFLGGRIKVTAGVAPTNATQTTITVMEI